MAVRFASIPVFQMPIHLSTLATLCLAFLVAPLPVGAQPSASPEPIVSPEATFRESWTLEDSLAVAASGEDPFDKLSAILEGLEERGEDPQWVGLLWNPDKDPEGEQGAIYVLRADSTVWVRAASGRSILLDNHVASELGKLASERTAYGDRPPEGLGYGLIDGRVYLYASGGVDATDMILVALMALLALIGAFIWLSRALKKSRERERASIEARRRLSEAREEERLRIAREIHDGPVQDLHAMRLMMGAGAEGPLGVEALQVIHNLRAISENLRPPALATMGLVAAVESLAGRFARAHPEVAVSVEVNGDIKEPSERIGLALFRVVQEGMNNSIQHGKPETIWVRIEFEQKGVRVSVEDDGTGFDAPHDLTTLGVEGHFGLVGMAERAESLGGHVSVRRRSPTGTRVEAWLPHPVHID